MTFNFAELQQKVDRLLYNIAEQNRRAYQLFYDPTPRDVQLPQLDENGNLITVTIPNRAKILADFEAWKNHVNFERPGIRITPNQKGYLADNAVLPGGWESGLRALQEGESLSSRVAFKFQGGDPNNQPDQEEVDNFYADLGISKPPWFGMTVYAIEIEWNLNAPAQIFTYPSKMRGTSLSYGAFIRRLQGSIEGSWWRGTSNSELPVGKWKFCGDTVGRAGLMSYLHVFIQLNPGTGKIQIVAPAVVIGGYADKYWNIYPYINGSYED